jgi:glycosyltransferase involved in cell wall biosynthesis
LPGVTFHGELPNAKALELLATTHVLAFPSVREFGGGVVVEAMANGVVPVVMNYGGPGEIVDDASGIRLPLEDDGRTEARLATAFAALAADPAQVQRLAEGARQRALSAWTWEAKVLKTLEIYRYVTGAQNARPALLPPP